MSWAGTGQEPLCLGRGKGGRAGGVAVQPGVPLDKQLMGKYGGGRKHAVCRMPCASRGRAAKGRRGWFMGAWRSGWGGGPA